MLFFKKIRHNESEKDLHNKIDKYIEEEIGNVVKQKPLSGPIGEVKYSARYSDLLDYEYDSVCNRGATAFVSSYEQKQSFSDRMKEIIRERDMSDVQVYKDAHIDRRLFSKICGNRHYNPSKDTCIALILALGLDIEDAEDLLSRAGYTLSRSSKRDLVIEYCIRYGYRFVDVVNAQLDLFKLKTLGR